VARATERALATLLAGKPMAELNTFEDIVGLPAWADVESRVGKG
jgi:hypothetical protein